MIYWLITGLAVMLFRSYGWDYAAPADMSLDRFWAIHRAFSSIAMLCFVKAAGNGRSLKNRLFVDVILAFLYADVFDRILGITYLNYKDWFILPIWGLMNIILYWKLIYYSRIRCQKSQP